MLYLRDLKEFFSVLQFTIIYCAVAVDHSAMMYRLRRRPIGHCPQVVV